jgi:GTPase SAR1 family protein
VFKVILLGESNVGKTSIMNRYVRNVFYENQQSTIGIDFANKPFKRDDPNKS